MTKLASYLHSGSLDTKVTQAEFARMVGADQSTVSQWCNGERRPGLRHALAIERVTHGAIPAAYWLTVKASNARTAKAG